MQQQLLKELLVSIGTSYLDLYEKEKYAASATHKLVLFFGKHLWANNLQAETDMRRVVIIFLTLQMLSIAFSAHTFAAQEPVSSGQILGKTTRDWTMQVVSDDLDYPWAIAYASGRLLITEKAGNIVMIENGVQQRHVLQTSDPIADDGGAGLLGMALPSNFTQSGIAYFYHSYRSSTGLANKVIQAHFDGKSWRESRVLLTGIPGHRLYNGGRIAIGTDGYLYVTTGWAESREWPQDLGNLAGKVLRIGLDGHVPEDNPFPNSYVYSYGHRNPQGLTWNPAGELFVVEHGQSGYDEINLIKPGANYGWPLAEGSHRRTGLEPAWLSSDRTTWAPSGAAFSGNELLVAALGMRGLFLVDEAAGKLREVFSSEERIRDVLPDERDLYLISTNRSPRAGGPSRDRLLRISPRS